tara:strand:- start:462 stop:722 length:261 start_codon:yes stop_codon:yes gene_type:complete
MLPEMVTEFSIKILVVVQAKQYSCELDLSDPSSATKPACYQHRLPPPENISAPTFSMLKLSLLCTVTEFFYYRIGCICVLLKNKIQ